MGDNAFVALVMVFILALAAASAAGTSVDVRPGYLDTARFQSAMGKIYIDADSPGRYTVSITGVPEEWLDYPSSVNVQGEEVVSYVVVPRTTGKYTLYITVKGPGGRFDFENRLWVGYPGSAGEGVLGNPAEKEPSLEGQGTGMFSLSEQDSLLALYAFMMIVAVGAVFVGHAVLKEE